MLEINSSNAKQWSRLGSRGVFGQAILSIGEKYQNLMIVPCFWLPLQVKFNLYKLSEWELQHLFSENQLWDEIHQKYRDVRSGHLTNANNKI